MTACTYALVPSSSLSTVTSMCHAWLGAHVRSPTLGLAGYSRSLGRRQPRSRMSLLQVPGCAKTLPMRVNLLYVFDAPRGDDRSIPLVDAVIFVIHHVRGNVECFFIKRVGIASTPT